MTDLVPLSGISKVPTQLPTLMCEKKEIACICNIAIVKNNHKVRFNFNGK